MAQDLLSASVAKLFAEVFTPRRVREVEAGGAAAPLWRQVEESGFLDALVPEARGGAGMGLAEAFPVLFACGEHAVPLPVAHTMAVRAVLATAGLDAPAGPATFASCPAPGDGPVACARVPFGRVAEWVAVDLGAATVLLPTARAEVTATGVHGALEADLRWAAPPPDAPRLPAPVPWRELGACLHAALLAGAMERAFTLTVAWANERSQFGKPIGKFQAIQQQLSVMAEQVFAARMAAQIGCSSATHLPAPLAAAVAKARASEAATTVAAVAHAVHGAMGITAECDLGLFTRRLHAWRLADGSERHWAERLGAALLAEEHASVADFARERIFQGAR